MRCAACDVGLSERGSSARMKCGEYWDLCGGCQEAVMSANRMYNWVQPDVAGQQASKDSLEFILKEDKLVPSGRERVYITRDMEDAWDVLDITSRAPSPDAEAATAAPYTLMVASIASRAAERAGATNALNRFLKEIGEAP